MNKNILSIIIFTLLLNLLHVNSFGAAHVTISAGPCSAGVDYIEFQINVSNSSTGGETLYISSPGPWRITHLASILPTGANTFSFDYIPGTADPVLAPLFASPGSSYSLSYNPTSRLMQANYSNATLGSQNSSVNAPMPPGTTLSAGRYRLTLTSGTWVPNSSIGLSWMGTTSGLVAYVDTNSTVTSFNTSTNRTLDTLCSMNTPLNNSITSPEKIQLSIFPNPSSGRVYLKSATPIGKVTLLDMQGKKILETTVPGKEGYLDVHSFDAGLYYLTYEAAAIQNTVKLLIR